MIEFSTLCGEQDDANSDAAYPNGGIILDTKDNIYGTTVMRTWS